MVCGYMIGLENCEHAVKLKKRFSIELIENNVIVNDIEVFPASIIKNLRCNIPVLDNRSVTTIIGQNFLS